MMRKITVMFKYLEDRGTVDGSEHALPCFNFCRVRIPSESRGGMRSSFKEWDLCEGEENRASYHNMASLQPGKGTGWEHPVRMGPQQRYPQLCFWDYTLGLKERKCAPFRMMTASAASSPNVEPHSGWIHDGRAEIHGDGYSTKARRQACSYNYLSGPPAHK